MIVKDNHFYMALLGEQCVVILPVLPVKVKHIAIEGKCVFAQAFFAVASHIVPGLSVVCKEALCNAGNTRSYRQVKEKYRVAILQPMGERAVKVAVNDPSGLVQLGLQNRIKRVPLQMLPAAMPIEPVQMHQGKRGFFGQLLGKGGFAGTCVANDQDSIHCKPLSA